MEIVVNAFYLIANLGCELLLYAIVDGAVKFLQNTRLPLMNFGYLLYRTTDAMVTARNSLGPL